MTEGAHPGATGVLPEPIEWNLSSAAKRKLIEWLDSWDLERRDDGGLLVAVEQHARTYLHVKAVAEQSSAGAIKKNLRAAELAAGRLLLKLQKLDGNSNQLLALQPIRNSTWSWACQIHSALKDARELAQRKFSVHGARPKDERIQFAAQLLHALREHTSAEATSVKGGIFEDLLRLGFELIGDPPRKDLHTLAEQALSKGMQIQVVGGVTHIPRPERKKRNS